MYQSKMTGKRAKLQIKGSASLMLVFKGQYGTDEVTVLNTFYNIHGTSWRLSGLPEAITYRTRLAYSGLDMNSDAVYVCMVAGRHVLAHESELSFF